MKNAHPSSHPAHHLPFLLPTHELLMQAKGHSGVGVTVADLGRDSGGDAVDGKGSRHRSRQLQGLSASRGLQWGAKAMTKRTVPTVTKAVDPFEARVLGVRSSLWIPACISKW